MTSDVKFTDLTGNMLYNRRYIVELNSQRSRCKNKKKGLPQGSVILPVQPVNKNTRSFIYADDLCIATQDALFEKTESTLSDALDNIGEYYARNHLRANTEKTQTCVFHIRNRETNPKLNISWCGQKNEHTPCTIYMGVILGRTLSYCTHIEKVKTKNAARNNVMKKFSNSKWGVNPVTTRTTALSLSSSTEEYICLEEVL